MYYESDGDSGCYSISLFTTEEGAKQFKSKKDSAYAHISPIEVKEENLEAKLKMPIEETLCPECNGKMVSRKGQYGMFWGCAAFPQCKGTRDNQGRSKADRARERNNDAGNDGHASDSNFKSSTEEANDHYRFRKS